MTAINALELVAALLSLLAAILSLVAVKRAGDVIKKQEVGRKATAGHDQTIVGKQG